MKRSLLWLILPALLAGCNYQGTVQQADSMVRPQQDRRYVRVNALNLRSCPTTQCKIKRVLRQGDSGLVLQEKAGWAEMLIDYSDSQGWVAAKYLSVQPVMKQDHAPLEPKKPTAEPPVPAEQLAEPTPAVPPRPQEEMAESGSDGTASPKPGFTEELAE